MDKESPVEDANDGDNELDGCDVAIEEMTSDEELPVAEGGVA